MWEASEQTVIGAPPAAVWAVVADIEGHTRLAGSGEVKAIRMAGPLALGATFEADIAVGVYGSFVARGVVTAVEPERELSWVSYPPLEEGETEAHQIEVHWSFRLSPSDGGTAVDHTFRVPRPEAGADELEAFLERTDRIASVRAGMRQTLANLEEAAGPA
jgi:uncharacterized protein YndB with AHSA1/START domain